MNKSTLEHVNMTVSDPEKTAKMLCDLFGWKVRWKGEAINKGITYHVGSDNSYIAIYKGPINRQPNDDNYNTVGGLNHIGIVVEDLDGVEKRVTDAGYEPHSHGDYEPGKRFYFNDHDDIEIEVISYDE